MSLSVDFYVRVFVRIYTSPAAVKDAGSKLMYVYQSQGCDSFYTQRVGRKVSAQHVVLEHLKPHVYFSSILCMVRRGQHCHLSSACRLCNPDDLHVLCPLSLLLSKGAVRS